MGISCDRDELELPMANAALRRDAVRKLPYLFDSPSQNRNFQAIVVVDVDVQRRD